MVEVISREIKEKENDPLTFPGKKDIHFMKTYLCSILFFYPVWYTVFINDSPTNWTLNINLNPSNGSGKPVHFLREK